MTRHTLARFLRLAVMSGALLSCLLALHTPVLALAIYDALAQVSVSAPGPLPPGTGTLFLLAPSHLRRSLNSGTPLPPPLHQHRHPAPCQRL